MRVKVVIDGADIERLADFWCDALGYERLPVWDESYLSLRPAGGESGTPLLLQRVHDQKQGKNRVHLDLHPDDGPETVRRLSELGASLVGDANTEYLDAHGTVFQVMADPAGNEFCVVWRSRPAPWDEASMPRSDGA